MYGKYPSDGFVVSIDIPGEFPIFVRDSDLEAARVASEEKGKSVSMTAVSWNGSEEEEVSGDGNR